MIKILENFSKIDKIKKIKIEHTKNILKIVFIGLNKNNKSLVKTRENLSIYKNF